MDGQEGGEVAQDCSWAPHGARMPEPVAAGVGLKDGSLNMLSCFPGLCRESHQVWRPGHKSGAHQHRESVSKLILLQTRDDVVPRNGKFLL